MADFIDHRALKRNILVPPILPKILFKILVVYHWTSSQNILRFFISNDHLRIFLLFLLRDLRHNKRAVRFVLSHKGDSSMLLGIVSPSTQRIVAKISNRCSSIKHEVVIKVECDEGRAHKFIAAYPSLDGIFSCLFVLLFIESSSLFLLADLFEFVFCFSDFRVKYFGSGLSLCLLACRSAWLPYREANKEIYDCRLTIIVY